jgi:hypothetical protein
MSMNMDTRIPYGGAGGRLPMEMCSRRSGESLWARWRRIQRNSGLCSNASQFLRTRFGAGGDRIPVATPVDFHNRRAGKITSAIPQAG